MNARDPIIRGTVPVFGNPSNFKQIPRVTETPIMSTMDKIAGLKEILALDPRKQLCPLWHLPWELANRGGKSTQQWQSSTICSRNDPDYTAGYFMAAQTLLQGLGEPEEAIDRLKDGISCARPHPAIAMPSVRCRECSTNWTVDG